MVHSKEIEMSTLCVANCNHDTLQSDLHCYVELTTFLAYGYAVDNDVP